jgi:hypothetical protein
MKKENQNIEIPLQLNYVDSIKKLMLDWAKQNEIKLHTIDCVVPFVIADKSLSVWLFYETEQIKNGYETNGKNEVVKNKYLHLLKEENYPNEYLKEVCFFIDTDENVVKNFEGNYFYRLR